MFDNNWVNLKPKNLYLKQEEIKQKTGVFVI